IDHALRRYAEHASPGHVDDIEIAGAIEGRALEEAFCGAARPLDSDPPGAAMMNPVLVRNASKYAGFDDRRRCEHVASEPSHRALLRWYDSVQRQSTSIGVHSLAGDVAGLVAGQEARYRGDLLRARRTTQGGAAKGFLIDLPAGHIGLHC